MMRGKKSTEKDRIIAFVSSTFKNIITSATFNIDDYIADRFDVAVFTGQKRTVAIVKDTVLKMISSREGLQDNINAILVSEYLAKLAKQGKITEDDLELFALATPVNDDPFIIEAKRYTSIREYSGFKEWYEDNRDIKELSGVNSRNYAASVYVYKTKELFNDCVRIQEIISKYFVGSDLLLSRVIENYGIDPSAGRLVLIDLGSILPKYRGTDILCNHCNADMRLLVVKPKTSAEIDLIMQMKTGLYSCSSPGCVDSKENIKELRKSANITDSIIFEQYSYDLLENQDYISDVIDYCQIYLPTTTILSYRDFKKDIKSMTGNTYTSEELTKIWINSLPYIINDALEDVALEINDEVSSCDFKTLYDLEDYVEDLLPSSVDIEDEIIQLYVGMMFIKNKAGSRDAIYDGDVDIWEILNSRDKSTFIDKLEDLDISSDDIDDIYDAVKYIFKGDR